MQEMHCEQLLSLVDTQKASNSTKSSFFILTGHGQVYSIQNLSDSLYINSDCMHLIEVFLEMIVITCFTYNKPFPCSRIIIQSKSVCGIFCFASPLIRFTWGTSVTKNIYFSILFFCLLNIYKNWPDENAMIMSTCNKPGTTRHSVYYLSILSKYIS